MKRTTTIRLGITGGIGSGKSYVSDILTRRFGIPVYNCDVEAKRLNIQSDEIRQALTQLVGPDVYAPDGTLRKSVLAAYLFASADHARQVNAIVHPIVARDFQAWAQAQQDSGTPIVAMESAILFESGFDHLVDHTLCVTAPRELCLQRAMQRDGATRQAIEQRMAQQMDDEERRNKAHHTILNDGSEIDNQINEILKKIK